jgi:hypothetical protein
VAAFLAIAVSINAVIFALMRLPASAGRHQAIALAACCDLLITIPAAYYVLVIRRGRRPLSTLWPVVLAGLFRALFLFPLTGPTKPILAGAGEAALVAFVAFRTRRGAAAQNPIFRAIAWEIAIFQYVFAREAVPPGAQAFTIHRESGFTALLGVAIGASIVEAAGAHLIV